MSVQAAFARTPGVSNEYASLAARPLLEPLEPRLMLAADIFEPNDTFVDAFDLVGGPQSHSSLSVHEPNNDDWYKWTASNSATLSATIYFSHQMGDLDLYVYNSAGQMLDSSTTTTDNEFCHIQAAQGQTYYVRVHGYLGATNDDYTLALSGDFPIPHDRFEPNDTFAGARFLGSSDQRHDDLTIHPIPGGEFVSNPDYYRWRAPLSGTLTVDTLFLNALGDLNLELLDSNGNVLDESVTHTDNERVSARVTAGQYYVIHVYGWVGWTSPDYDLVITGPQLDFGDAPLPYPTTGAAAASHETPTLVWLGGAPDAEPGGQPHPSALGDDNDGTDDEDGVVFPAPLIPGQASVVQVTVVIAIPFINGAFVQGWVDFDQSGSWEAAEMVLDSLYLPTGSFPIGFAVPADATPGDTFARFRISLASGLPPTGAGPAGEVEDVMVTIENPPPEISIDNVQVTEGDSGTRNAVFTVSLSNTYFDEVSVEYTTEDVSAVAGSDYLATSGTVWFGQGATEATIQVPVMGDPEPEPNETFRVVLSNPQNATIADGIGIGTIINDDQEMDFGDAPKPYPTQLRDGARHPIIRGGTWLGPEDDDPDPEPDGQPHASAQGDDKDGNDDEDGVRIPTLYVGESAEIDVFVNTGSFNRAYVGIWIDLDQDGTWHHPGEQIFGDYLTTGPYRIPVTVPRDTPAGTTFLRARIANHSLGPTGAAEDGEVEDHQVTIAGAGPQVVGVYVRGTGWATAVLDHLQATGLGSDVYGYSIPVGSPTQLDTLPWVNLDQVSITFSESVQVAAADFGLYGIKVPSYFPVAFSYDDLSYTATWYFDQLAGADKLLLALSDDVTDTAGNPLNGEWTDGVSTWPSGDGTSGGDFRFRLNVLPGDVDQSGEVRSSDTIKVRRRSNTAPGDQDYSCFFDVDCSGEIRSSDTIKVRRKSNTELPPGEPVVPPSVPLGQTGESMEAAAAVDDAVGAALPKIDGLVPQDSAAEPARLAAAVQLAEARRRRFPLAGFTELRPLRKRITGSAVAEANEAQAAWPDLCIDVLRAIPMLQLRPSIR